jgi:hypothetical protein
MGIGTVITDCTLAGASITASGGGVVITICNDIPCTYEGDCSTCGVTPTPTPTVGVLNYNVEVYDTNCDLIRTEVASCSGIYGGGSVTLMMYYVATAPIEGTVVMRILSTTYSLPDAYPTIIPPYYNSCPDAWVGFNTGG